MGLKTSNYVVKGKDITLPQAYALIKSISIDGEFGTARFVVQTSREKCFTHEPIEVVRVNFAVNRSENIMTTAYHKASETYISKVIDPETNEVKEVECGMPFHGWEDDLT